MKKTTIIEGTEETKKPERNMKKEKMSKHQSNYARKSIYLKGLSRRTGYRVFGFEVTDKPWKVKH